MRGGVSVEGYSSRPLLSDPLELESALGSNGSYCLVRSSCARAAVDDDHQLVPLRLRRIADEATDLHFVEELGDPRLLEGQLDAKLLIRVLDRVEECVKRGPLPDVEFNFAH